MSTRSLICKEQQDGTYYGIYCHSDGYLTYNGAMLLDHYFTPKRVDALLALGDISSLGPIITPDPSLPHSFDYDKRQDDVVVAYGRDRGEKDIDAKVITLETALGSWCEYMYIFGKDGKWRYYDLRDDEPELRDVEEDLASEYRQMGIERPEGIYGFFPPERIAEIKKQQSQMHKSQSEM